MKIIIISITVLIYRASIALIHEFGEFVNDVIPDSHRSEAHNESSEN